MRCRLWVIGSQSNVQVENTDYSNWIIGVPGLARHAGKGRAKVRQSRSAKMRERCCMLCGGRARHGTIRSGNVGPVWQTQSHQRLRSAAYASVSFQLREDVARMSRLTERGLRTSR